MNVVFLDALTLGDFSLSSLQAALTEDGDAFSVWPTTSSSELLERIAHAELLITNKVPLMEAQLSHAPHLRCILVCATGVNNVDLKAAAARGIVVCNVRNYAAHSVAEQVFAGVLSLRRHLRAASDAAQIAWSKSPVFCLQGPPMLDLYEQTIGIVGLGAIGEAVAGIARGFGMNVLVAQRDPHDRREGRCSLEELFERCHVISLHCPLTAATRHCVDRRLLSIARSDLILVNMARGGIVNEQDLGDALRAYQIAGAVVDVLEQEPPLPTHPLLGLSNCLLTPHIAWASEQAKAYLLRDLSASIVAFKAGKPRSVVSL